jgi:hypothetical protein
MLGIIATIATSSSLPGVRLGGRSKNGNFDQAQQTEENYQLADGQRNMRSSIYVI